MTTAAGPTVGIRRSSLYLSRALYDRYFAGLDSVVLLRRERAILILPVRNASAGGYLLKRRNSNGDRVVSAGDFLRDNGLDDDTDMDLPARWSMENAALLIPDAFPSAN